MSLKLVSAGISVGYDISNLTCKQEDTSEMSSLALSMILFNETTKGRIHILCQEQTENITIFDITIFHDILN